MTTLPALYTDPNAIGLERTRFFARQLVTPDDLTQDQRYFRDKARRHNRLLHGWGIVCGCDVAPAVDGAGRLIPWTVSISPGYVLGPHGDEIVVSDPMTYDLRRDSLSGADACDGGGLDPWCSDVRVSRQANETLYVAIRYDECEARPVRVATAACGCEEAGCEYSRIRDSFEIKALTSLPSSYPGKLGQPSSGELFRCDNDDKDDFGKGRPCSPCPSEPWVVLAAVTPGPEGQLAPQSVDGPSYRRYVVTFADFYISCAPTTKRAPDLGLRDAIGTAVRTGLTAKGLDLLESGGGQPEAVATLPLGVLKGVPAAFAKRVGPLTVQEVALTDKSEWVKSAIKDVNPADVTTVAKQAEQAWESAAKLHAWSNAANPNR